MNNSNLLFGMSENYSKNSLSQDECHNLAQKYLEKSAEKCSNDRKYFNWSFWMRAW